MKKLCLIPLLCLLLSSCPSLFEKTTGANPNDYDIHIYSAQDLMDFRDDANANRNGARSASVLLMNNITLPKTNWVPISTFSGIFNGNDYTIFGLYFLDGKDENTSNIGLFNTIDKGGGINTEIKNLTIEDAYINAHDRVGAIASRIEYDVKITNTKVVFSYIIGNNQVGGFVGSSDGIIDNCFNYAYVEGFSEVGGIAGEKGNHSNDNVWKTRITNTIHAGIVQGNLTFDSSYVGGIVGNSVYATVIQNCKNIGEVTAVGGNVGGITGKSESDQIINCSNEGLVQGSARYVGGITGHIGEKDDWAATKIVSCVNEGLVIGDNKSIGGIAGANWRDSIIEGSYNIGTVRSTGLNPPKNSEPGAAAGLAGENLGRIQGSFNAGKVEALGGSEGDIRTSYIAGLVGSNSGTIIAAYNIGFIYEAVKAKEGGSLVGENTGTLISTYNAGLLNSGNSRQIVGLNSGRLENTYFADPTSNEEGALPSVGSINNKIGVMNESISNYNAGSVDHRFRLGNNAPSLYKLD